MNDYSFESVYRRQLAEILDAEQQMLEEMPRILRAVTSPELRTALELHLVETKEHVSRLAKILDEMDEPRPRAYSDPMRALLAKGRLLMVAEEPSPVRDAALIATAREIEYHESAAYSTARLFAKMLGHDRAAALLGKTLKEEQDTAADLAQIAETLIMGEELEDSFLAEDAVA